MATYVERNSSGNHLQPFKNTHMMYADTSEELWSIAHRLHVGGYRVFSTPLPHLKIPTRKKELAVRYGAIEHGLVETGEYIQKKLWRKAPKVVSKRRDTGTQPAIDSQTRVWYNG